MKILDEELRFIIPNRILRELLTLIYVDEDPHLSQHKLAARIGVSSAMANTYIRDMREAGWIQVVGESARRLQYHLTDLGRRKKALFLHQFSRDICRLYALAKREFEKKLLAFYEEGLHRVVFFGAAEAGELIFNASLNTPMEVLAIVDNDVRKHTKRFGTLQVTSPKNIESYHPDGVIITTFGRVEEIYQEIAHLETKGIRIRAISPIARVYGMGEAPPTV